MHSYQFADLKALGHEIFRREGRNDKADAEVAVTKGVLGLATVHGNRQYHPRSV